MSKYLLAIFLSVGFLVFWALSVLSYPSPADVSGIIVIPSPTPQATPTPPPPSITLIPDCGQGPNVQVTIELFNWDNNETISLMWNETPFTVIPAGHQGYLSLTRAFSETNGIYEIRAESSGLDAGKDIDTAEFNIPCPAKTESPPQGVEIITNPVAEQGIINRSLQAINGPLICVDYGDPYSPWNSPWKLGSYTQRYKIEIPADYPSDIVRVELFDPDSMNSAENAATVLRTNAAVNAGLEPTESLPCDSGLRQHLCLINTGEADETGAPIGGLTNEQINPFWFSRVDENRGTSTLFRCGYPTPYRPDVNTNTLFQLYYYAQEGQSDSQRIELAQYTGQAGTESTDHLTDLRWVSPGTEISFGYDLDNPGIDVPVDPGSANNFEIDLTQEIPNVIVDPVTGNRHLYLDVTAIKGSSANGFAIWAGPPGDEATIPSEVNQRNLYLLNNPANHLSQGIHISTLDFLPLQSAGTYTIETPLLNLQETDAGKVFTISAYDMDAGAGPPPITFFLDTMPEEEWSLVFGNPGVDPDGIPYYLRCEIGDCWTQWIDPPYKIRIPSNFTGGTLLARYGNGINDKFGFEIKELETESSCSSYPIAIPANALAENIEPGTSIQVHKSDGFDWLSWNVGITPTVQTLADSLTYPGNMRDYSNHNDTGAGLFGFAHVIRGYADPTEVLDVELQKDDWVATNASIVTTANMGAILNAHIQIERPLRLPLSGQKVDNNHQITDFANFKLVDYDLDVADPWLQLQFLGEEVVCKETAVSPVSVQINGHNAGHPHTIFNFTATIDSLFTTQPLTYTWQIDNQAPFTQTNTLVDTITTSWTELGTHTITVTAENETGTAVTDSHTITINPLKIYLPFIHKE